MATTTTSGMTSTGTTGSTTGSATLSGGVMTSGSRLLRWWDDVRRSARRARRATTGRAASGSAAGGGANAGAAHRHGHPRRLSINTTASGTAAGGTTTGGGGALPGPQPPASAIVRLRDVARMELGAQNYNEACTFDGHPSAGLGIFLLPGTNALDVAQRVHSRMEELKKRFPDGVDYAIAYDTTPFIRESVADVVRTLFVAVCLVGVVVLVFLQNWRAVLIPMLAVPVAIVGTFAVMAMVGFSLNKHSSIWAGSGHRHRGR